MLLQKVSVAMGLFALASASVVVKRQGTTIPIPDACTSQCTILSAFASLTSPQAIAPLCTSDTEQTLITCYTCIETNAPSELSPQDLTVAQSAANSLVSACAGLGSPIPAFSVPGATGTTAINTAGTTDATLASLISDYSSLTNGGPTAAPSTSGTGSAGAPAPSTTTTSHSGAMTLLPQTVGVAGLVVAFTAMMVV